MSEAEPMTKAERKAANKQLKREQAAQEMKQQKLKRWFGYGLIGLIGLGVGYYIWRGAVVIPEGEKNKPVDQVAETDWYRGQTKAPVVIVEYSDFQCPACKLYQPIMNEVLALYPDQVVLVYRHFPLKQIHLQAEKAALAAEAAGDQGKFWEMHDLLFQNQEKWADNRSANRTFEELAEQLNLDMTSFKKAVRSKEVKARVNADYMSALERALSATPSFFVNGEPVTNPEGVEGFRQIVDEQLRAATAAAEAGN